MMKSRKCAFWNSTQYIIPKLTVQNKLEFPHCTFCCDLHLGTWYQSDKGKRWYIFNSVLCQISAVKHNHDLSRLILPWHDIQWTQEYVLKQKIWYLYQIISWQVPETMSEVDSRTYYGKTYRLYRTVESNKPSGISLRSLFDKSLKQWAKNPCIYYINKNSQLTALLIQCYYKNCLLQWNL